MTTFVISQVEVALAFMPTPLIGIVLDYYLSPEAEMSFFSHRLVFAGSEPIQGNERAFAMRTSEGAVVSWGNAQHGGDSSLVQARLKNVKAICGATGFSGAFAAIVGDDNTVVCWGKKTFTAAVGELKEVEGICSTSWSFAALKKDGTVTTWGHKEWGGDSSPVQSRLKGVKAIYGNDRAFAAVLDDGTVETWGSFFSMIPPSVKERLRQVRCISGSADAFAALLNDGTVETWGGVGEGEDSSKVASELTQVVLICATDGAFAALKKDGTVISWGSPDFGGDSFKVRPKLKQVVAIGSTADAFAAVRSDGRVVTWGLPMDGSSKVHKLREVVAVRGTAFAFAALRKDGTVATWGRQEYGGDSSAVQSELTGVVSISSTARAFAAQKSDGTVVTWGDPIDGGDSSSVFPKHSKKDTKRGGRATATERKKKGRKKGS